MPYYRIKIWTKLQPKPFEGIRLVENTFVDNVFRMYETSARTKYGYDFLDLEVQQLSKLCTAVLMHLEKLEKQRKKRDESKQFGRR
ncbi:MAG: hypothetical protein JWR18_290 [Segetibacter sp.]|jgi:hypothetical protein|nr:hypothetical protein [Segetibacter sp.]